MPKKSVALADAELKRRRAIIDELGALQAKYPDLTKDQAHMRVLKSQIEAWADTEKKANEPVAYEGERYIANVTARENKREIPLSSRLKLLLIWGREKFLARSTMALKQVDDDEELTFAQKAELIAVEPNSGDRKVKCVPRALIRAKAA